MYEFIRIQYIMGRITEFDVRSFAPKYLTEEQVEDILGGVEID